VRLPDGRLDAAAALDPRAIAAAGGAGRLMATLLAAAGAPRVPGLAEADVRLTPPLTRRSPRSAAHRLLAVGDAAGFIEPFTGEGLAWALLAGRAVVPFALDGARRWDARLARAWTAAHRAEVARRQRLCRVLAAWLRHPSLVRAGLALAARRPALAHGLLARLGAPPAVAS
jgi:menaquinone-9 beta-reductase